MASDKPSKGCQEFGEDQKRLDHGVSDMWSPGAMLVFDLQRKGYYWCASREQSAYQAFGVCVG